MSSFLGWLLMRISISPMPPVMPHSVAVTVAFLVFILNLGTIGAGGGGGGGAGGGGPETAGAEEVELVGGLFLDTSLVYSFFCIVGYEKIENILSTCC